jgi:glucose-6-phosphate 1-dehydrogenase
MNQELATILVIFGVTGDLANRYFLPSMENIAKDNKFPDKFRVLGITRKENIRIEEVLDKNYKKDSLKKYFELYAMDTKNSSHYENLYQLLKNIEEEFKVPTQILFYLSIPGEATPNIIELIGRSNLKNKNIKILLEKPFGRDLENAKKLMEQIDQYFKEEQIYRIDHYLAKEEAQNVMELRNTLTYKNTWNKDFIKSIEIVGSETIGIEGRVKFYEKMGALRDFAQSHLLELAALTLMELPKEKDDIPIERYNALKELNIVCDITKNECVKRAQYEEYREEVGNTGSMTETFVSINVRSNDPKWMGVPITLTTGKKLKETFSKIIVNYEGEKIIFDFKKKEGSLTAYRNIFFAVINGQKDLFVSGGEVIESWRILEDVQETWKNSSLDLTTYKSGSSVEEILKI